MHIFNSALIGRHWQQVGNSSPAHLWVGACSCRGAKDSLQLSPQSTHANARASRCLWDCSCLSTLHPRCAKGAQRANRSAQSSCCSSNRLAVSFSNMSQPLLYLAFQLWDAPELSRKKMPGAAAAPPAQPPAPFLGNFRALCRASYN